MEVPTKYNPFSKFCTEVITLSEHKIRPSNTLHIISCRILISYKAKGLLRHLSASFFQEKENIFPFSHAILT